MTADQVTKAIIGAAIEVHRHLGPGLLESVYETCLAYELATSSLNVVRQMQLPIVYKGIEFDCGYRVDLLVEDSVMVELKVVEKLEPIHKAQLLTYLRLSGRQVGLLLNFNEPSMRQGIKRIVHNYNPPA